MTVPASRISLLNGAPLRNDGEFVLYWMVAFRRSQHNFALERAVEIAKSVRKPLVVLEALRAAYPFASRRIHRFVLDGMADNARAFEKKRVLYYPYVEPEPGAGSGLLTALAEQAVAVVSDEFPGFFLPRMLHAVAPRLRVRLEAVDSNGLLPLRLFDKAFYRAFDFRRALQRSIRPHLLARPAADPLSGARLPALRELAPGIRRRWPAAPSRLLAGGAAELARIEVAQAPPPVDYSGGSGAARAALRVFVTRRLERYAEDRNHPDLHATSSLSPYLHFGQLSAHEVFESVARAEDFDIDEFASEAKPSRSRGEQTGFWRMRPGAEAFLDQLLVWRELGYNFAFRRPDDHTRYSSLPEWARHTLGQHGADPRPSLYTHAELEAAATHDELWNAAQRELVRDGRIHNYMRMLWGKKVIEWSASPEAALETLIELNDRYALDGRDPNSYSGIFWCFGRYDRAWGPERAIFGTVRYMTSDSARRKLHLSAYLQRFAP